MNKKQRPVILDDGKRYPSINAPAIDVCGEMNKELIRSCFENTELKKQLVRFQGDTERNSLNEV